MSKRFLTWKLILIPIVLFGVLVVSRIIFHTVDRFLWSREVGNKLIFHVGELPACGEKKEFFTVSPIKDGLYRNIVPLGELGPSGGHVIPTKHVYFMSPIEPTQNQTDVDVVAPGDLYVTYVEQWENKTVGLTEYFVYTSPCADVEVDFYHLNTLNPKIMNAFTKRENCRSMMTGNISYNWCGQVIKGVQLKAGEFLGMANPAKKGGIKQFFDFEMSDHRTSELKFANPDRWVGGFDFKHIVCPIDYFTPELRQKFFSQMADYHDPSMKRTVQPLCGEYMQDVAETAQGVWFAPGKTADMEENTQIALVHHNILTQKGVFSIGTQAMPTIEGGAYPFDPKSSGLIDRNFKDITADGQVYCFEPTGLTGNYSYPFRVILQMISPTRVKIEGQKVMGCGSGPWVFESNAVEFER